MVAPREPCDELEWCAIYNKPTAWNIYEVKERKGGVNNGTLAD